ncbi:DUF4124 domain-containing protein [Pelagibaculum spongiae]|nr:DUF4124 domain-containing protein [Pelagibaculum spongiae]
MLMRFFFKLMLFVAVAFGALFVIKGPGGVPFLKLDQLKAPELSNPLTQVSDQISAQLSQLIESDQNDPDATSTVWRWQDENGQWHFSDSQVNGAEEKQVTYNTSIKISQLVQKSAEEQQETGNKALPKKPTEIDSVFLPDNAAKALEQAQQVEAMLKQANENRLKQLDNL